VHVWDLKDGKAVRFQQYVDTRQLASVLGSD
jgi:ketosteroid isomerase-like protein